MRSVWQDEYLKCKDCDAVWNRDDLSRHLIPGTLVLRGHCPDCGHDRFEEIEPCTECFKEERLKGSELGELCQRVRDRNLSVDPITVYPVPFESVLLRRVG